jgi:predicted amidohydrolase YtcJ
MNKTHQTKIVADSILIKGRIATMDERQSYAQAVAIKDGRFIAVGTDQEIMAHKGEKTKVIDTEGRTVIPGLNDSHLHPFEAA